MFYKKWFDVGDLVLYKPKEGFACYDCDGNMSTVDYRTEAKVGIFLGYTESSDWEVCEVYIGSQEKKIIVPQHDIVLLSKNTEL